MNEHRAKFYTELMKTLTAFILGTGAGIFTLVTSESPSNWLLVFAIVLFLASLGLYVALFVYLENNS